MSVGTVGFVTNVVVVVGVAVVGAGLWRRGLGGQRRERSES